MDSDIKELVELAINKILALDKRVEKYFSILLRRNELDFILSGGYVMESEIDDIVGKTKEQNTNTEENAE